ncbi:MAG: hypothetical protein LQ352_008270 [Teloschistes flavicans]|nr:MAG: hypothetical protein LQ352_008270 [Teloschistes flavicans]
MQWFVLFLALLGFVHQCIAASASVYTQQLCTTKVGTKSVKPVPSTTYALTVTLTKNIIVTSTPLTTITPKAVTSTITTSVATTVIVTGPPNTDTLTITQTDTATSTITGTSTATATETASTTTTLDPSTSTVPPPAGFTPIRNEPGFVPKIKAREALGLAVRAAAPSQIVAKCHPGKPVTLTPQLYPTSVICGALVETITTKATTKTASTTSTITAATPTSYVYSTVTYTSTSTIIPAPVTSTISATGTATTTYAACGPTNIATTANGGHSISEVDGGVGNSASFVSVDSAYSCCVACITSSDNCRGFVYIGISGFECELINGNTCDPGVAFGGLQFKTDSSATDPGLPVGNGRCGIVQDGGQVDPY